MPWRRASRRSSCAACPWRPRWRLWAACRSTPVSFGRCARSSVFPRPSSSTTRGPSLPRRSARRCMPVRPAIRRRFRASSARLGSPSATGPSPCARSRAWRPCQTAATSPARATSTFLATSGAPPRTAACTPPLASTSAPPPRTSSCSTAKAACLTRSTCVPQATPATPCAPAWPRSASGSEKRSPWTPWRRRAPAASSWPSSWARTPPWTRLPVRRPAPPMPTRRSTPSSRLAARIPSTSRSTPARSSTSR